MSFQDHNLTETLHDFLSSGEMAVDGGIFDRWLQLRFPHVRVQGIGDAPMFYFFSMSRCNPPREDAVELVRYEIMVLNWSMMTAWRIYVDNLAGNNNDDEIVDLLPGENSIH
jgi:hypothetical protein